jgi:hypothetical protein
MSKDPRKDELKKAWKLQQRQQLAAHIPMPQQYLQDLFDYLDQSGLPPCDHTLRHTTEFFQQRSLEIERVVPWLREHGGHCDCEVIANVEDRFHDILAV